MRDALVLSDRLLFLRVVILVKVINRVTSFRDRFLLLSLSLFFTFSDLLCLFSSPCSTSRSLVNTNQIERGEVESLTE